MTGVDSTVTAERESHRAREACAPRALGVRPRGSSSNEFVLRTLGLSDGEEAYLALRCNFLSEAAVAVGPPRRAKKVEKNVRSA